MPSSHAVFNAFNGNVAYTANTPTSEATFNAFNGNVAYAANTPTSEATFNAFNGNVAYVPNAPLADGTFNIMTYPLTAAPPVTGDGVMLYPISEDPNNRPILRY